MTKKKAGKSWGEMSNGERKAVLVGWAAIIVLAGWFFWPGGDEKSAELPVAADVKPAKEAAEITYQAASPEALAAATRLMAELDAAMQDGMPVLETGDPHAMGAHSRHFGTLVDSASARFGSTIFEPLGRCGVASNFARAWWQAQISATLKGGVESAPGSIRDALEQFQINRAECLQSTDPIASAQAAAKQDAELHEKFGGGRECLTTFTVDSETKQVVALPKPAHCKS